MQADAFGSSEAVRGGDSVAFRGQVLLEFEYATTAAPRDFGWGVDNRRLAVQFTEVEVFCGRSGRRIGRGDPRCDVDDGFVPIYGLSGIEPQGRWSDGARTSFLVRLDEPIGGPVRIEISHSIFAPHGRVSALVRVNGTPIGPVEFNGCRVAFDVAALDALLGPVSTRNVSTTDTDPVEVSIIVPMHERPESTFAAIVAVLAASIAVSFEVIVVDEGSSAGGCERLRGMGLPVRMIGIGRRLAYGSANNLAAERARGRVLLMLGPTAFLTAGCVEKLLQELHGEGVGAAGPVFRHPDGTIEEAGGFMTATGGAVTPRGTGFLVRARRPVEVDFVSCGCLAVRRADFLAVGGFDPALEPARFDQVDLCLRLRAIGKATRLAADAVVHRVAGAASPAAASDPPAISAARNRQVMLGRWSEWLACRRPEYAHRPLELDGRAFQRQSAGFPGTIKHCVVVASTAATDPDYRSALALAAALSLERPTVVASATRLPVLDMCQHAAALGLPCAGLTTAAIDDLPGGAYDAVIVVGDLLDSRPPPCGRRRVLYCPRVGGPGGGRDARRWQSGGILNFDAIVVDTDCGRRHCLDRMATLRGPPLDIEVLPPEMAALPPEGCRGSRSRLIVSLGPLEWDAAPRGHEATLRAAKRLFGGGPGGPWRLLVCGDFSVASDSDFAESFGAGERGPVDIDLLASPPRRTLHGIFPYAAMLVVSEAATAAWSPATIAADVGAAIAAGCVPVVFADSPVAELCRQHDVGMRFSSEFELEATMAAAADLAANGGVPQASRDHFQSSMTASRRASWARLGFGKQGTAGMASGTPSDAGQLPAALVVLGCHRSGTSALARVLSLTGADLPHDLLPGADDNPSGFWESLGVVTWNDAYLQSHGSSWHDPLAFFSEARLAAPSPRAIDEVAALVRRTFPGDRAIVLKDPRISVLTRVWDEGLRRAGYAPVHVAMIRDPREVAASLMQRNGLSQAHALGIWATATLAVDLDTRSSTRLLVTYDSLLDDPCEVGRRVRRMHDVGFVPRERADQRVVAFIDRDRRHHHCPDGDLAARHRVVLDYYRRLVEQGWTPRAEPAIEQWLATLRDATTSERTP